MTCSFCMKTFNLSEAEKTCNQCAMFGGCQKVKCPYCGYEGPKIQNHKIFENIKKWKGFLHIK